MKSPYCFIIKAVDGRRYDNIRNYEGKEFIISSSQEDHKVSNRFATVISTPIYYNGPIKPNDVVVVHHNVFKFYYDMKGRQKSSWHHLTDDLFIVEIDQVYLYSRDGGRWAAPKNEEMTEVTEGDIVSFTPDSEYEFRINEEVLYRMYNRNICLKK